jgi:hypothetical protein
MEDKMRGERENSKSGLMRKYFLDGLEMASGGGRKKALIRQIFYAVRATINLNHGIDLDLKADGEKSKTIFNTFTQRITTEFMEKYPELEDRILFDGRGFFLNPFDGSEVSLSTANVTEFITKEIKNRIYQQSYRIFDIPDNLKFNQVLFCEKEGFNIIFKERGLIDELNLGVMSSKGFGTRATKKLMKYFINQGMKVYALTDCDIAGYLIASKFGSGNKTFKEGLDVEWIGLTVADIDRLGKRNQAEIVKYTSKEKDAEGNDLPKYTDCLEILTKEEYNFFVKDKGKNLYRRVELNALTVPELIRFVKSKIKANPIKPTLEQLKNYIKIDETEIIKSALLKAYGDGREVDIDIDEVAKRIHKAINKQKHWTDTMEEEIESFIEKKSDELAGELGN